MKASLGGLKPYVLMVGPKLIPTDAMIFEGSQYLLNASDIHVNEYITIHDGRPGIQKPVHTPTHIIILGTPWVWDKCWLSTKYNNLKLLLNMYPEAKRLFLGVGSALPLGKEQGIKADLIKNSNELVPIFRNALVMVRDMLAAEILEDFKPVPLPCPAFYAIHPEEKVSKTGGPVLFWYSPEDGISGVDFKYGSDRLAVYNEWAKMIYDTEKPSVYCIDPNELYSAWRVLNIEPQIIRDSSHAKLIIRNASAIYSGRVHLAIPGYGIKTLTLRAVDSRANTLYDVESSRISPPHVALGSYIGLLRMFIR